MESQLIVIKAYRSVLQVSTIVHARFPCLTQPHSTETIIDMSEHAHPTTRQLVAQIAEALGETEPTPLEQICRLIKAIYKNSSTMCWSN